MKYLAKLLQEEECEMHCSGDRPVRSVDRSNLATKVLQNKMC